MTARVVARLAALAGSVLVIVGIALVWVPAAVVLAGVALLFGALLFDPDTARRVRR